MDSDKPAVTIILRSSLLVVNSLALAWAILKHPDLLLILNLALFLIIQIVFLVRFQYRNQQKLNSILSSIEQNIENRNGFDGLRGELSKPVVDRLVKIESRLSSLKLDIEKQNQFLQALIDNLRVGIIIYNEKGIIEFVNHMALELLQVKTISSLDTLKDKFPLFYDSLLQLSHRQPVLHKLKLDHGTTTISLRIKNYRVRNEPLRILTMHIIQQEMEDQEIDSWQKLIRVLTHEIMNSTGPISSTLDTLIEILTDEQTGSVKQKDIVKQEMLSDILKGLHIIKLRSQGLSHFVQHFRSLTLLPKPVIQPINIEIFFTHILFLFKHDLDEHKIRSDYKIIPPRLLINADSGLMEQVLINLMKNSIEALKNISDPWIRLEAYRETDNHISINITDNGVGIREEMLDQIFVPFFTTRENGSGIGLSISRQIVRLHAGKISVQSEPGIKTIFKITI